MDGGEFATNPRTPQSTKILCICTGTSCNITVWGTDYLMTQFQLLRLSGITCIYISEWIMKSLFEWREREACDASRESRNRTRVTPYFKITSVENPSGIRDFAKPFELRQTRNTELPKFNSSNAALNPICHLLTLLGAHHILHVSRIRVKTLVGR